LRKAGSGALLLDGLLCDTWSANPPGPSLPDETEVLGCATVGLFFSLLGFTPAQDLCALPEEAGEMAVGEFAAALADKKA
jgi:hypothetical protein